MWLEMSLTHFQDPTNIQLTESPYQWDKMMAYWDNRYRLYQKTPKVRPNLLEDVLI